MALQFPNDWDIPHEGPDEDIGSIMQWVNERFPAFENQEKERIRRVLRVFEECTEFCMAAGVQSHQLITVLQFVAGKEQSAPGSEPVEYADLLITLAAYENRTGINSQQAVNYKMRKNRQRPKEHTDRAQEERTKRGLDPLNIA